MSGLRPLVTSFQSPAADGPCKAAEHSGLDVVVVDDLGQVGTHGLRDVVGCPFFIYGYPEETEQ